MFKLLKCIFFGILFLINLSHLSFAYIPSARMILEKAAEGSLKSPLYIEQQVHLSSGNLNLYLKEQWLIENENNMKLIVKGDRDLNDQIQFQTSFNDNQKFSNFLGATQGIRMNQPLFEKLFFIKNPENLKRFLIQEGIVGQDIFQSENFKKIPGNNGFQYQPEPMTRLGRLGGKVAYVISNPQILDSNNPGIWIEQDAFQIMKIRNSLGAEFRVDKLTTFSKGARWYKTLELLWGKSSSRAQITVTSVKSVDSNHRSLFQKKAEIRTTEFDRNSAKSLVEEFYQTFR